MPPRRRPKKEVGEVKISTIFQQRKQTIKAEVADASSKTLDEPSEVKLEGANLKPEPSAQTAKENRKANSRGQQTQKLTDTFKAIKPRRTPPPPLILTKEESLLIEAYKKAIKNPRALNKYQPWTPQVYGETLMSLVRDFVEFLPISPGSTFVDLGSGVGQVVLQVASAVPDCKLCFGVEKETKLGALAKELDTEFQGLLGDSRRAPVELLCEDMLTSERVRHVVSEADVIFVNNKAFGASLDRAIVEQLLVFLKPGAKVVSFVKFIAGGGRTRASSSGDDAWLRVTETREKADAVSWTANPIPWYIHTVEHQVKNRVAVKSEPPDL